MTVFSTVHLKNVSRAELPRALARGQCQNPFLRWGFNPIKTDGLKPEGGALRLLFPRAKARGNSYFKTPVESTEHEPVKFVFNGA